MFPRVVEDNSDHHDPLTSAMPSGTRRPTCRNDSASTETNLLCRPTIGVHSLRTETCLACSASCFQTQGSSIRQHAGSAGPRRRSPRSTQSEADGPPTSPVGSCRPAPCTGKPDCYGRHFTFGNQTLYPRGLSISGLVAIMRVHHGPVASVLMQHRHPSRDIKTRASKAIDRLRSGSWDQQFRKHRALSCAPCRRLSGAMFRRKSPSRGLPLGQRQAASVKNFIPEASPAALLLA